MSSLVDIVTIREFEKGDVNFILDSFIHCLSKYTESMFKGWDNKDIYNHLEQTILFALTKLDYSLWLAVDKEDTNSIFAYLIADSKSNHIFFNYTKYTYRGLGIQKALLLPLAIDPTQPVTVNYQTKEALKLHKLSKVSIKNLFLEQLMESHL